MNIEYVLNELSVEELASSDVRANEVMDIFVEVLKNSREIGIRPNIRTHKQMGEIQLSDNYFISNWCENANISKEKRLYIKKLLTNSPILHGLEGQILEDVKEFEAEFEGKAGVGITLAHLMNNPVLSFCTHSKWEAEELSVQICSLKVDADSGVCDLIKADSRVINFAKIETLEQNKSKIINLQKTKFSSVADFWEKKGQLFLHLDFSPSLLDNLNELGWGNPILAQVFSKIASLDEYCQSWKSGPCQLTSVHANISVESQSTMQQFGAARIFKTSNGEDIVCEHHARLTPGAQRIHFNPHPDEKKIFVGYVGRKLPTSQSKT